MNVSSEVEAKKAVEDITNECIFGLGTCPVLDNLAKRQAVKVILDEAQHKPTGLKQLEMTFQSLVAGMDFELSMLSSFCVACAIYNIKGRPEDE